MSDLELELIFQLERGIRAWSGIGVDYWSLAGLASALPLRIRMAVLPLLLWIR